MSTPIVMSNIFPLTEKGLNEAIKEKKAGNYRFSIESVKDGKKEYNVRYVGRSDSDVKTEILQQGLLEKVDNNDLPLYSHFKFVLAGNADEAYKNECNDYHHFLKWLDNEMHPATPKDSKVKCPIEGCEFSSKPKSK